MNKKISKTLIENIAGPFALAIFFLLDRCLKQLALEKISFSIWLDYFNFNFTPNYYIAFSLPISGPWLTSFIGLVITILITYYAISYNKSSLLEKTCLLGIILGALSNFIDRLKYGFVVDYLDLKLFTIFNLADVLITVGSLLLIYKLLKKES